MAVIRIVNLSSINNIFKKELKFEEIVRNKMKIVIILREKKIKIN